MGGLGLNRVGILINAATDLLSKEKRMSVEALAAKLGYRSVEYFRRSQLKLIISMSECIEFDRMTGEVVWVCDEG